MGKVLILEESVDEKPVDYDHVFSFCLNVADSYPEDYVTEFDFWGIYDRVFNSVMDWLKSPSVIPFSYQGVDLLQCFKKIFFEYVFYVVLRYETFKRLIARYPGDQFCLDNYPGELLFPSLQKIIQCSCLRGARKISSINMKSKRNFPAASKMRQWLFDSDILPSTLQLGFWKRARVVVFSDLKKAEAVIHELKNAPCVLYTNVKSPSLFTKALRNIFSFYQTAMSSRHTVVYCNKAKSIIEEEETSLSTRTIDIGGLDASVIFTPKVNEVLNRELPRLLFEIDSAHHFFKNAQHAKSVLLDEDISPAKNAFCQVARQYGVATYVECHGALGHKSGFLPLTADRIFVWGHAQRDKLVRWGCPPERIVVSGCSRYLKYQRLKAHEAKLRVARSLKLNPQRMIIVAGFPPVKTKRHFFEHKIYRVIFDALNVFSRYPSVQFIIKLHPGDQNSKHYHAWARQLPQASKVRVVEKIDPLLVARAADIMVVHSSTFAADGLAMGKPVICLHEGAAGVLEELKIYSAFYYANSPSELSYWLDQLLVGKGDARELNQKISKEYFNDNGAIPAQTIALNLATTHSPKIGGLPAGEL